MLRPTPSRIAATLVVITAFGSLAAGWPPEKFTNLKVLPTDIPQRELVDQMTGFTRALGVRCTYCHVGEEGKPLGSYDFASDEKVTKRKARDMIRMVRDLKEHALAGLEQRMDPPVSVGCVTCHRGAPVPRMLQDVMAQAYDAAGADSAIAVYQSLRKRYYGGFAYDFGEVPLSDVANRLRTGGHPDDALRLLALNVEMNPDSKFAMSRHALSAVERAFSNSGAEEGRKVFADLRGRYGPESLPEQSLNTIGYQILGRDQAELAIAVFTLATETFPKSSNAFDSLGEAQEKAGHRDAAIASYRKALERDPESAHAKQKLAELTGKKSR